MYEVHVASLVDILRFLKDLKPQFQLSSSNEIAAFFVSFTQEKIPRTMILVDHFPKGKVSFWTDASDIDFEYYSDFITAKTPVSISNREE